VAVPAQLANFVPQWAAHADLLAVTLLTLCCLQAEKRRETILVGLNKTRDALSISEDKIKQLQLEAQRTNMDLVAKTSELAAAAAAMAQRHQYPGW
jgi:hypothetical protein